MRFSFVGGALRWCVVIAPAEASAQKSSPGKKFQINFFSAQIFFKSNRFRLTGPRGARFSPSGNVITFFGLIPLSAETPKSVSRTFEK
jgi:hypothetical protein